VTSGRLDWRGAHARPGRGASALSGRARTTATAGPRTSPPAARTPPGRPERACGSPAGDARCCAGRERRRASG
jgi:hypothetical protein